VDVREILATLNEAQGARPNGMEEGGVVSGSANNIPEASKSTDTIELRPAQSEKPINHVDAEEAPEAVNVAAGAPSMKSEDDDNKPISAYNMELRETTGIVKATTAVEKPSSTHEAEPTEAKAETTLPVQGVDDSEDTKGNDAGPDAAAVTASANDQAPTVPAGPSHGPAGHG
jgi:hypothetical protein